MLRRLLLLVAVAALMAAMLAVTAVPAFAHNCPNEGETNAVFAEHHIVPLATTGGLGEGGHVPGTHQGFAGLCGVQSGG